jgi:ubiquitin-protein ligase
MLSPRIRRLKLDYEQLQERLAAWPVIRLVGTAGMPPELYRFQYSLKGLYVGADGTILERNDHLLEVNLSLGYPRRAPQCRMLTPVFHPNFDDSSVCIGDFWAASEALHDLVIRIGRMIAYQEYNTKSPLNGLAAKWAAQNAHLLPVDARPVAPPLAGAPEVNIITEAPAAPLAARAAAPGEPQTSSHAAATEPAQPRGASGDDPWTEKIVIS